MVKVGDKVSDSIDFFTNSYYGNLFKKAGVENFKLLPNTYVLFAVIHILFNDTPGKGALLLLGLLMNYSGFRVSNWLAGFKNSMLINQPFECNTFSNVIPEEVTRALNSSSFGRSAKCFL